MTSPSEQSYLEFVDSSGESHPNNLPNPLKEKWCGKCETFKFIDEFSNMTGRREGKQHWCKSCMSENTKNRAQEIAKTRSEREIPLEQICSNTECPYRGVAQPSDNFYAHKGRLQGINTQCKVCCDARQQAWEEANREKRLAIQRRSTAKRSNKDKGPSKGTYQQIKERKGEEWAKENSIRVGFSKMRVTKDWFEEKLASQEGKCAICGKDKEHERWARFCIDHDHDCCKNRRSCDNCRRGLLCHACNIKLGMIEDAEWIQSAVTYLRVYGKDLTKLLF